MSNSNLEFKEKIKEIIEELDNNIDLIESDDLQNDEYYQKTRKAIDVLESIAD